MLRQYYSLFQSEIPNVCPIISLYHLRCNCANISSSTNPLLCDIFSQYTVYYYLLVEQETYVLCLDVSDRILDGIVIGEIRDHDVRLQVFLTTFLPSGVVHALC